MVRRCLGALLTLVLIVVPGLSQTPEIQSMLNLKKDIYFLASDECEGRGPGTKGIDIAADYISKQLSEAGLKPGGVNGGYFQPFTIKGAPALGKPNEVVFNGPNATTIGLEVGKDCQVLGLSGSGKADAPLVFVGYGLQAKGENFDEYDGIDVAGKIVVMLRRVPRWSNKDTPFGGKERDSFASLEKKVALAEANKAAGVILVNDPSEAPKDNLPAFAVFSQGLSSKIPCVHVKRAWIEPILSSGLGMSLAEIEKGIDDDLKPRSGVIKGWTGKLETTVSRSGIPVKNIIGVLEGKGPLANEVIVVGAHYDHLGYGGAGSLAKTKEKQIHHGADDNGSGTTSMMELARRFGAMKDRQGRKLVFMAFSAEERGLLGSQHFCKEPLFPLADVAAMVNIDMVGKLRPDPKTNEDKVLVEGVGTAKNFDGLIEKLNAPKFKFVKQQSGIGPSDHASFTQKKIPVLFFWTGTHPDYHRPTDTADRINLDGMKKIVDFTETVVAELASDPVRPVFIEVKGGKQGGAVGAPKGPRLGITPNYESDKEGVLVDAVAEGGAAEKGGLKAGDRIVELAGKNVTNLDTYMVIMASQKLGQEIEIGVIRDQKKVMLKVTPK